MIYPFDFHTHTTYCDGNNTAEEMVQGAINNGLQAIGFSGHSYLDFDDSYCMSEKNTQLYISEVNALKEKYREDIDIYCGIEQDYYSDTNTSPFDYVIGSVHHIKKGEKYLSVDLSKDDFVKNVSEYYNGDYFAFCNDYYKCVSDVHAKTGCDIVGHIDLVTKFNEKDSLFSSNDKKYVDMALCAVEKLLKEDVIFEVNTGALSRGYKTSPYPQRFILEHIFKNGGQIILSGDSHGKDTLCFQFENTIKFLKTIGFKTVKTLKSNKFIDYEI